MKKLAKRRTCINMAENKKERINQQIEAEEEEIRMSRKKEK